MAGSSGARPLAIALALALAACGDAEPTGVASGDAPRQRAEFLSPVYTIDRLYGSMEGPSESQRAVLVESGEPELVWITGYRVDVTGADGETGDSPEFMCHNNMDNVDAAAYRQRFPAALGPRGRRLFSLDQGTLGVAFPEGFGVPAMSDQPLMLDSQVLNHNVVGESFQVRQRIGVDFVRSRDLAAPLVPLAMRPVFNLVLVDGPDGHLGLAPDEANEEEHGPGCSIAEDVGHPRGVTEDRFGRRFSSFWIVPPGRHDYHTRVSSMLELPYDTTIHLASAHLHPYAESIELYDLTDDRSVVKLHAEPVPDGIGLAAVETASSREGFRLYADHEYDLVSVYDNTSQTDQDAMATLFLYVRVRDLAFEPTPGQPPYARWQRVEPEPLAPAPSRRAAL